MPDDETAVLTERLRFAAESLALEFEGLSRADAERLVFAVAREFLSEAQVAQFVPTFATRRVRQLLRGRPAAVEVVIPDDTAVEHDSPRPAEVAPLPPRGGPVRPPDYYASEAKRLLERAKALRAASLR